MCETEPRFFFLVQLVFALFVLSDSSVLVDSEKVNSRVRNQNCIGRKSTDSGIFELRAVVNSANHEKTYSRF